jgi:hypothetical protein
MLSLVTISTTIVSPKTDWAERLDGGHLMVFIITIDVMINQEDTPKAYEEQQDPVGPP